MDQTNTSTSGGSNAQDFQPLTRNPQGNVGGGLQPNSATNNNIFNQPGVNQQALPQTNSLRVLSQGTRNSTPSTTTDTAAGGLGWDIFLAFFVMAAVIVAILLLRGRSKKPAGTAKVAVDDKDAGPTKAPAKPKAKKKPKQKRKKKKR